MTYAALLALVITSLAPHVPPRTARQYARIIEQESAFRDIAATWLAAHVWVESRYKTDHISRTADHGLGQVHVAVNGSARFLGREWLLQIPRVNLRETVRIADMWRSYHNRECGRPWAEGPWAEPPPGGMFEPSRHSYWAHMKWGRTGSVDLVEAVAWIPGGESMTYAALLALVQIPRVNLRDMWRSYHNRECGRPWAEGPWAEPRSSRGWPVWLSPGGMFEPSRHSYWAHMKWGRWVKNTGSVDFVEAVAWLMVLQMRMFEQVRGAV